MKTLQQFREQVANLARIKLQLKEEYRATRAATLVESLLRETKIPKKTMSKAHSLQKDYDSLGSPGTQRVRNPFSVGTLIYAMLPRIGNDQDEIELRAVTFREIEAAFKACNLITNPQYIRRALHGLDLAGMVETSFSTDRPNKVHKGAPPLTYYVRLS